MHHLVDISFINAGVHSGIVGVDDGEAAIEEGGREHVCCLHLRKEDQITPRLHTLSSVRFFQTLILRLLLCARACV